MAPETSEGEAKTNGTSQPEGMAAEPGSTQTEHSTTSGANCQMNGACLKESFTTGFEWAKKVLMNPVGVWTELKATNWTVSDMYQKFIIPLSAIGPIAAFIGVSLLVQGKFFSGILHMVLSYGIGLGMTYLFAILIQKLAPQFDGNCSLENALKLILGASLPMYFASAVMVIPFLLLIFVPLIAALAGLYAFYQGIPEMTGVSTEKRLPFFCVLTVCIILTSMIVQAIV